jgi:hypothetical protein
MTYQPLPGEPGYQTGTAGNGMSPQEYLTMLMYPPRPQYQFGWQQQLPYNPSFEERIGAGMGQLSALNARNQQASQRNRAMAMMRDFFGNAGGIPGTISRPQLPASQISLPLRGGNNPADRLYNDFARAGTAQANTSLSLARSPLQARINQAADLGNQNLGLDWSNARANAFMRMLPSIMGG